MLLTIMDSNNLDEPAFASSHAASLLILVSPSAVLLIHLTLSTSPD